MKDSEESLEISRPKQTLIPDELFVNSNKTTEKRENIDKPFRVLNSILANVMKRKADIKADDSDHEPLVNKTSNASKKKRSILSDDEDLPLSRKI